MDWAEEMRKGLRKKPKEFDRTFEEIEQLEELMDKIMGDISGEQDSAEKTAPSFLGVSIRIDADGRQHINEVNGRRQLLREREKEHPLKQKEILAEETVLGGNVVLTAELAGVTERQIRINAAEETVIISTRSIPRHYKEVRLENKIQPKSVKTSFKNGILELVFAKAKN
ncbi:MAG: Hsp20/alpha crystallin family protein [Candidatus Diapherotrites archaeon]